VSPTPPVLRSARAMRVLGSLALLLGLLGCDGGTTLVVVRVDSELTVPDELDEIVVEVEGRTARATLGGPDDPPLPRTVELRATGDGLGPFTVIARGFSGGAQVAQASRDVMFVADDTVEVTLLLSDQPLPDAGVDGGVDDGGVDDGGVDDAGVDAGPRDAGPLPDGCVVESCNARDDDCDGDIDEDTCDPCVRTTFRGHVYMLCDSPMAQREARDRCMAGGYDLVSFDDAAENQHVVDTGMGGVLTDLPWIGLRRRGGSPFFDWQDGSGSDYRNWAPDAGQPGAGSCVLLRPDGTWRTADCAAMQPFICEVAP